LVICLPVSICGIAKFQFQLIDKIHFSSSLVNLNITGTVQTVA